MCIHLPDKTIAVKCKGRRIQRPKSGRRHQHQLFNLVLVEDGQPGRDARPHGVAHHLAALSNQFVDELRDQAGDTGDGIDALNQGRAFITGNNGQPHPEFLSQLQRDRANLRPRGTV